MSQCPGASLRIVLPQLLSPSASTPPLCPSSRPLPSLFVAFLFLFVFPRPSPPWVINVIIIVEARRVYLNSKFELRPFYRCEYTSRTQLWVAVRPDLRFDSCKQGRTPSPTPLFQGRCPGYEVDFGSSRRLHAAQDRQGWPTHSLTPGKTNLRVKCQTSRKSGFGGT